MIKEIFKNISKNLNKIIAILLVLSIILLYRFNNSSHKRDAMQSISSRSHRRVLFADNFKRRNGLIADNYGHRDRLRKWRVTSQRFYCKKGRGYTKSRVFRAVTYKNFKNFSVSASILKKNNAKEPWEGVEIFFRYRNPNNLYYAGLRNDNGVQIKKKYRGAYTTLASAPFKSRRLNHWYKLKVVARGSRIQLYVDGVKCLEARDRSILKGKVGLRTDNTVAYFDNYKVVSQ